MEFFETPEKLKKQIDTYRSSIETQPAVYVAVFPRWAVVLGPMLLCSCRYRGDNSGSRLFTLHSICDIYHESKTTWPG